MNTENLLATITRLDPQGSWSGIGALFGSMEICEDEITKAQARHPEHSKAIWGSFRLLCPKMYILEAPEPVYRAHCAELLDRAAQGLDTTLGTRAEVMMVLSETSLKAPLVHTGAVLYAQLLERIFPSAPILEHLGFLSTWADDQTTGTLLAKLSKKCRDPERKLACTKGK